MNTSIRIQLAVASLAGMAMIAGTVSTAGAERPARKPGKSAKPASSKTSGKAAGAAADPGECKPWVCDVPEERQSQALVFYEEGNKLFEDSLFTAAAERYRAAIELWDHPAIHYNLALAQSGLDQPIAAYQSLQQALRHDGEALQAEELGQARAMVARLREKIAEVHVVCHEAGAAVTLDGKPLFTGPGEATRLVLVGQHQIDARKTGHVTASQAVTLGSEKRTRVEIRLIPEDKATVSIRPLPLWLPWATTAAGVGLGVAGLTLHGSSRDNYDEYTRQLRIQCARGCEEEPPGVDDLYGRARWRQGAAYGAYALASVAVLSGLTMVYFNQARTEQSAAMKDVMRISVTPVVSPTISNRGFGVAAALRF